MTGLLLAAGTGSRLGERTEHLPKALIQVTGTPLIDYALDFIRAARFDPIVVVTGFESAKVRQHLASASDISLRENKDYLKGNLLTLLTAEEDLQDGFTVFNVDHIYSRQLIPKLQTTNQRATALCDFDRSLGPDDMKVKLHADHTIKEISKKLMTFDGGYIGSTIVPKAAIPEYFTAVERVQQKVGESAVVEQVLAELAASEQPPQFIDTSGIPWLEVDDEIDYQKATTTLQQDHAFLA